MIEANETHLAWEEDEVARWIKPGGKRQIMTLSFDCNSIPEICVSSLLCIWFRTYLTVGFSTISAMDTDVSTTQDIWMNCY